MRRRAILTACSCLGILVFGSQVAPAWSQAPVDPSNFLTETIDSIRKAIAEAIAARQPTPPVGVAHQWRTKSHGSFEANSPLLALEAAELDGTPGEELIALTTSELVVFSSRTKLAVLARAPIKALPAVIRSRDPVGVISLELFSLGLEIAVRTSEHAHGVKFRFAKGALAQTSDMGPEDGFPLCPGVTADLEVGKNYFDPKTLFITQAKWPSGLAKPDKPFYSIECREQISVDGRRVSMVGVAGLDREIHVGCLRDGGPCPADSVWSSAVTSAGTAFETADLNRDGHIEIVSSLGKAPGAPERLRVTSRGGKTIRNKKLDVSVIAASAVDIVGDGRRTLFFAVRQPTDSKIHLWTLNRHP